MARAALPPPPAGVCKEASNINGHVVAGEASLSQFLLGGEYRRFFRCFARVAGDKNSLKVRFAVNQLTVGGSGKVPPSTGFALYYSPAVLIVDPPPRPPRRGRPRKSPVKRIKSLIPVS